MLFLAAMIMLHVGSLRPVASSMLPFAPLVVFTSAVLMGLRFNRSGLVFSVVVLAIADRALSFWSDGLSVPGSSSLIAYHAASILLPVNLMMLSLMRERGVFTYYGVSRMAVLALQPLVIFIFARLNPEALIRCLDMQLADLPALGHLAVSQPALIAFLLAFTVMLLRFALNGGVKESGFLWAMVTVFSSFATVYDSGGRLFLFTVAGTILLVSIIEISHTMAFRDELTGLPARRALKEDLLKLGGRYALAMVDIDHFKKFNDTYGHDVGTRSCAWWPPSWAGYPAEASPSGTGARSSPWCLPEGMRTMPGPTWRISAGRWSRPSSSSGGDSGPGTDPGRSSRENPPRNACP
jgi:GGDEF domain-containing protein